MVFISNPKTKAKHNQTPRDIYFSNLEEAYGNLPVPSDDFADIEELLTTCFMKELKEEKNRARHFAKAEIRELVKAIRTIQYHYNLIARLLGKEQKYG